MMLRGEALKLALFLAVAASHATSNDVTRDHAKKDSTITRRDNVNNDNTITRSLSSKTLDKCRCPLEGEASDFFDTNANVQVLHEEDSACTPDSRRKRKLVQSSNGVSYEEDQSKNRQHRLRIGASSFRELEDSNVFPCPDTAIRATSGGTFGVMISSASGVVEQPRDTHYVLRPTDAPTSMPVEAIAENSCERFAAYGSCDRSSPAVLQQQQTCANHQCYNFYDTDSPTPFITPTTSSGDADDNNALLVAGGYYNWTIGGLLPQPMIFQQEGSSLTVGMVTVVPQIGECYFWAADGFRFVERACHVDLDIPRRDGSNAPSLFPLDFRNAGCRSTGDNDGQDCIIIAYAKMETVACVVDTSEPTSAPAVNVETPAPVVATKAPVTTEPTSAPIVSVVTPRPTKNLPRPLTRLPTQVPTSSPNLGIASHDTYAPTSSPFVNVQTPRPTKNLPDPLTRAPEDVSDMPSSAPVANIQPSDCGTNLITDNVDIRFVGLRTCEDVALNSDSTCRLLDVSRNQAVSLTCVNECTPGCESLLPPTSAPTSMPVLNIDTAAPTVTLRLSNVLLYENDFESPNSNVLWSCAAASAVPINSYYGFNANGTGGDQALSMRHTLETLIHDGTNWNDTVPYATAPNNDIQNGRYSIGMLGQDPQSDLLGLQFNAQGRRYVNIRMDISSIDLSCGGGPFGTGNPIVQVRAIDASRSNSNAPAPLDGTVLASANATAAAGPNPWTFSWNRRTVSLDLQESVNGRVSIVWDMLQSGYGALDNLLVVASDTPNDVDV